MKTAMAAYTEEQLKRAFEVGFTAALEFAVSPTEEFNMPVWTPVWVHNTNMNLFVWSQISWDEARARTLDPRWQAETSS
jgi:hypothetical protein